MKIESNINMINKVSIYDRIQAEVIPAWKFVRNNYSTPSPFCIGKGEKALRCLQVRQKAATVVSGV